ncbi:MAG: hypothetical protein CSA07_04715 [Bacteroidia bacterium]|nr:MAG: hypothetical protein CSA07_04715 [Bacteroidia bacterium]
MDQKKQHDKQPKRGMREVRDTCANGTTDMHGVGLLAEGSLMEGDFSVALSARPLEEDRAVLHGAYRNEFLAHRPIARQTNCGIDSSTLDILRNILQDLREDVPLPVFINNILVSHLRRHRLLINGLISERRRGTIASD